jgi:hypothetical protein
MPDRSPHLETTPLMRGLIRVASLLFALVTASAAVGGWIALDVLAATATVVPRLDSALEPSGELLATMESTVTDVRAGLGIVSELTEDVGESTVAVADIVDDVAALTSDRLPASLEALEATMPSLIETAEVIDQSMRTLSILGVAYDPEVPFDEALREVRTQLDGLPEAIASDGEQLSALSPRIRRAGDDTALLAQRIEAIDADLAEAEGVIADYRASVDELDGIRPVADDIDTLVPVARVALVVMAVAGIALAVAGLATAGRVPTSRL